MSERVRRPPLGRTSPIRNWRGVFGPPQQSEDEDGHGDQPRAGTGLEEAISRSVDIGYRVIDDYIRQGQEVARSIREGRASTQSLVHDTTDLATRMARYASDFVGAWMQLLEIVASNSSPAPQPAPAWPAASSGPQSSHGAAPGKARVELVVTTSRAVEASLEMNGSHARGALRVHALRSADPAAPRIDDVTVTPSDGNVPVTVHVSVPTDHPEGAYEGLVIDDAGNVPVGVLRLTILRPS